MGSGRYSPDSRWRRFFNVTAVRKSDRSLIGAFLPDLFGARYNNFSDVSRTPQRMGGRSGLPVPIYPLWCTSPRSSQFRVASHDIQDLVGNDREFHRNSFWYIFSARCGPQNALSVRRFCRAEHHEVAPSWWRSSGLREHPVAIDSNFDLICFQPRDVHRCNRQFLDSNKKGILSIALLELFRITQITLHCPFHESSISNRHWMGCRRSFAADRLEVLLDEDDSRTSRVREHGSFLQLHVAIQTLWSQCLFPRAVRTNRWIVHSQVSPCLFALRLCLYLNVQQTLAHNSSQVSPCLTIGFLVLVGFVGSLHFQRLLNPIFLSTCL